MKKSYFLAFLFVLTAATTQAQTIYGVTSDDKLFSISDPALPGATSIIYPIIGISVGQTVKGIDFRPLTGELFALGYDVSNGNSQLYTINTNTGVATPINTVPILLNLGTGSIAFDFNPTVDRIRVVGANKKNYRLNPITGTVAATDADINFAVGDPNQANIPTIGACAYTNSYIGSETTTLYDYDQLLNMLTTQVPPNAGTLNTIGSSGIVVNIADPSIDMDIWFNPATHTNVAYIAANTGTSNNDHLYTVNLATGAVSNIGMIGLLGISVKAIAVEIDRTLPANVTGQLVYGITKTNRSLITFDTDTPELIRSLQAITGVTAGQTIRGMDVRPADRMLYALGYNPADSGYQVYRIDPATAVATPINAAPGKLALGSTAVTFDFNPTVDRIRVTGGSNMNYRLNPNDGSIVATDMSLSYALSDINAGLMPRVGTLAYINSYPGAATTVLYGIDDSLQDYININPPNNGTLNTMLTNVLPFNLADLTNSMDFYFDSVSHSNWGYLAANTGSSMNDSLYTLDSAGNLMAIGTVGYGIQVADIAVQLRYTHTMPAGLTSVNARPSLSAYPNPVKDVLTIMLPQPLAQATTAEVYDATGRQLMRFAVPANATTIRVDLSAIPSGLFTLQLQNGASGSFSFKGIKQ